MRLRKSKSKAQGILDAVDTWKMTPLHGLYCLGTIIALDWEFNHDQTEENSAWADRIVRLLDEGEYAIAEAVITTRYDELDQLTYTALLSSYERRWDGRRQFRADVSRAAARRDQLEAYRFLMKRYVSVRGIAEAADRS